jgi:hypothetical protein
LCLKERDMMLLLVLPILLLVPFKPGFLHKSILPTTSTYEQYKNMAQGMSCAGVTG